MTTTALARVAAVQMMSSTRVDDNLRTAAALIEEAAGSDAQLVGLPEYLCVMGRRDTDKVELREPDGRGPIQDFLAEQAHRHRIWLVGGTMPLVAREEHRVMNSVLVYGPDGARVARYDKIHLFRITKGEETYDEAQTIAPGDRVSTFVFAPAKKRAVFGLCYNPPADGHNYLLEVTVSGEIDPKTGMVVNLFDLKRVLLDVLEEFDHKNLNLDLPYFKNQIPTSENCARLLWEKLSMQPDIGALHTVRLCEDEDLFADVTAAEGLDVASVTRRYSFTAVQGGNQGHTWDLFVTVRGRIDLVTGMVTDIGVLDRLVHDHIVNPFDRQDLRHVLSVPAVSNKLCVLRKILNHIRKFIGVHLI